MTTPASFAAAVTIVSCFEPPGCATTPTALRAARSMLSRTFLCGRSLPAPLGPSHAGAAVDATGPPFRRPIAWRGCEPAGRRRSRSPDPDRQRIPRWTGCASRRSLHVAGRRAHRLPNTHSVRRHFRKGASRSRLGWAPGEARACSRAESRRPPRCMTGRLAARVGVAVQP